jgi:hypothetical protein
MYLAIGIGVFLLLWVVPAYVAGRVGRGRVSWVWGLLFGWIGVLGVWLWWRPLGKGPRQST